MAVTAAAPLVIHSLAGAEDSLIFISPFTGPSLEHRLPPPLQLLSVAPFSPEPPSATDTLDNLHALVCLASRLPESPSLYSLCRSRECLWSSSLPCVAR